MTLYSHLKVGERDLKNLGELEPLWKWMRDSAAIRFRVEKWCSTRDTTGQSVRYIEGVLRVDKKWRVRTYHVWMPETKQRVVRGWPQSVFSKLHSRDGIFSARDSPRRKIWGWSLDYSKYAIMGCTNEPTFGFSFRWPFLTLDSCKPCVEMRRLSGNAKVRVFLSGKWRVW